MTMHVKLAWVMLCGVLRLFLVATASCRSNRDQASEAPATPVTTSATSNTEPLNSCFEDSDQDGISNAQEGLATCLLAQRTIIQQTTVLTSVDTEGDGTPDYLDLDSDNDGISDLSESGSSINIDANNDGICDSSCVLVVVIDVDLDGKADFRDLDSDNDGISDLSESGSTNVDANNDGICDSTCALAALIDTDLDGIANFQDSDSDNDGVFDLIEVGGKNVDENQDGRCDLTCVLIAITIGADGDSKPNYLDPDKTVSGDTGAVIPVAGANAGSSGSDLSWRYSKLAALSLSSGSLSPVFSETTNSYTVSVSKPTITLTPTAAVPSKASITVNGTAVSSGSASGSISLNLGSNTITVVVSATGISNTTYTLTITRSIAQEANTTDSQIYTDNGDQFGYSISISGDTMVVGALYEDSNATGVNGDQSDNSRADSGAAYVYTRNGTTWTQQAYLKASNPDANDGFGFSVAISGETIVVGAWNESSNATGVNGNQSNNSVLGSGAVYVFTRNGSTWTQQAYIKASNTDTNDNFGYSVAISGDTIAVSSYREDSNATGVNSNQSDNSAVDAGAAYMFTRSGSTWTQQAYLKASNTDANDGFGISVAISGDTIVVGAQKESSNATGVNGNQSNNSASVAGAAYVFTRSGSTWTQQAYLKASNTDANDAFGYSVAISGDTIVAGSYQEDSNATGVDGNQSNNSFANAGAAYVFTRSGSTWTQQAYLKASNTDANDIFGVNVAISGESVVVGAQQESSNATGVNGNQSDNSFANAGAVYVFTRSGSTWTQQAYLKGFQHYLGDQEYFGIATAVSNETIVIGAPGLSSNFGTSHIFR